MKIEVLNKLQLQHSGAAEVGNVMDLDVGPLAMPEHIKIGGVTWDNVPILCYSVMVDEYDVWLEDQIKNQNPDVLSLLDEIYRISMGGGIILSTLELPAPFRTHAHVVAETIRRLADGLPA